MAVLTLRRIHATPTYRNGREVTISRRSVRPRFGRMVAGADELLAGYDLFRHQGLLERVRHEPQNRALRAQIRRFLKSVDLLSGTVGATNYAEYDRVVERFGTYPYPALRALKIGRSTRAVLSQECLRGIGDFDPLEHLATTWSSRGIVKLTRS